MINFRQGYYIFELYGAGSVPPTATSYRDEIGTCISDEIVKKYRGNAKCSDQGSSPGTGGYTKGVLILKTNTIGYMNLGGHGITMNRNCGCSKAACDSESCQVKGGFNGGGRALTPRHPATSGSGATDLRFEVNDVFHRVLVAGGAGGSDNTGGPQFGDDDGSGGAGGGLIAQGYRIAFNPAPQQPKVDQLEGFSFGSGEAGRWCGSSHPLGVKGTPPNEITGGGGGWFGGFSSQNSNGGGGGGSSFALTRNAVFPKGNITEHDDWYQQKASHPYAFDSSSKYCFENDSIVMERGIWSGNGMARITFYPITMNFSNLPLRYNDLRVGICCLFTIVFLSPF